MEFDPAFFLGPPNAFPLEVGLLQFVGAAVGVGNGHAVIGFFVGELASTGHCFSSW